jgi:hypothetical protein
MVQRWVGFEARIGPPTLPLRFVLKMKISVIRNGKAATEEGFVNYFVRRYLSIHKNGYNNKAQ